MIEAHGNEHLTFVIVLLTAAVIIVTTFRSLKLSPVLGYFVAGAAIGNHGFGLVSPGRGIEIFGEFGIVFLLFVIGLELTLDRLMSMRKHVFGFGSLQILITALVFGAIFHYIFHIDMRGAIVIGGGLALSSTAIVLQVLMENSIQSSQVGRLSISVLLMQDFAVVPLLVLLPLLNQSNEASIASSLLIAFAKAIFALSLIFFVGRLLLKPFFRLIAKLESDELFISATLLIVLGSAYITEKLELSMALGAFISGLMVAETEYAREVEHTVTPFKSLLLGLFFMVVGMQINFDMLVENIGQIGLFSLMIIAIKTVIIYVLCRIFKFKYNASIQAGLLLSQGSEFAFILFGLSEETKIIDPSLSQILMMSITCTMALTPLMNIIGRKFATSSEEARKMDEPEYIKREISDIDQYVVIIGFGRTGRVLADILSAEYIYYVGIDSDEALVKKEKQAGYLVYHGDVTTLDIFKAIELNRASTVVVTIPDIAISGKIVGLLKLHYPDMSIIAKSSDASETEILMKAGAQRVLPVNYEMALNLASNVMEILGFDGTEIEACQSRARTHEYGIIKKEESE